MSFAERSESRTSFRRRISTKDRLERRESRASFRGRVSAPEQTASTRPSLAVSTASEPARGAWNSKADYMFTCIGYAVGLGNICRFPYLVYENGGGAFVFPYIIMLFVVGIPMVVFETTLGQYSSKGPVKIWSFSPIFKGCGFAQVLLMFYVGIYYNVIISYAIFFLFASFDGTLPWVGCDNWWNTNACASATSSCVLKESYLMQTLGNAGMDLVIELANNYVNQLKYLNYRNDWEVTLSAQNITSLTNSGLWSTEIECNAGISSDQSVMSSSPAEEYMNEYVLGLTDEMTIGGGGIRWQNTLVFIASWILIYLVLMKGLQEAGKIIWFTAMFPYVVLTCFLIRGLTLDGAGLGLSYYLGAESDFGALLKGATWKNAATQILFSLSAAQGGMITLSSFNSFKNDNITDSLIICLINSATSIFGGLVVFSILGFMAKTTSTKMSEVVRSGMTLAFVSFPAAIGEMPGASIWSVVFFFMVLLLGLDTQFTVVEICTTAVFDMFSNTLDHKKHGLMVTGGFCALFCLLGLPLMTGSGIYWVTLLDTYASSWGLIVIAIVELVAVAWVYDVDKFIEHMKEMLPDDSPVHKFPASFQFWKIMWKFITPISLMIILIWSVIDYEPARYGSFIFPGWAQAIGWVILMTALILVPLFAFLQIKKSPGSNFKEKMIFASKPTEKWQPGDPKFRKTTNPATDDREDDVFNTPEVRSRQVSTYC